MGITSKIDKLNKSELSGLSRRINDLKKQAESVTVQSTKSSSAVDSLTASQLITQLAQAKRSAA